MSIPYLEYTKDNKQDIITHVMNLIRNNQNSENKISWKIVDEIFQYLVIHYEFVNTHVTFREIVIKKLTDFINKSTLDTLDTSIREKCGLYLVKLSPLPSWNAQTYSKKYINRMNGDDIAESMTDV